jgi:hypothetical protein
MRRGSDNHRTRFILTYSMPRPAYKTLGDAIAAVMDHTGVTTVALADQLRERGWKPDQSLVSKWRNGHARPHDLDILPDIEAICGVPKGTILRRAGYVSDAAMADVDGGYRIDETDPIEVTIWGKQHIPEPRRWNLIQQYREMNREPSPPRPAKRQPRRTARRKSA